MVLIIWAHSDGGGEKNRSAEGNKVLKYVLVHGRQWAGMGNGCLGSAVLRYILKLQKMANIDRRMTSRVNLWDRLAACPPTPANFLLKRRFFAALSLSSRRYLLSTTYLLGSPSHSPKRSTNTQ